MANSNNKHSVGLIARAVGVAKKLSATGLDLVNHVAPGSVTPLKQVPDSESIIDIKENENIMTDQKNHENPQHIFRSHVPKVTQQLLGRHYGKVNQVTSFISPNLNNKIADFFFEKLNDFVSETSSVDHVLSEVGAKSLEELAANPERSDRINIALGNQNKALAAVQGAISGATGVIGTAIDIPFSLALTLRTIYQSGRAHGFELNRAKEQEIVEYVFKQVDLGSIAEKQTLLVGLRAVSKLLETQDTQQLQKMLGSSNDIEVLRQWLSNDDGTFKWSWINRVPQISILSKLTPIAGAGIGAFYSWKLVNEANIKAQHIFSNAQQYLLQHPDEKLNVLQAFEKAIEHAQTQSLLATPEQIAQPEKNEDEQELPQLEAQTIPEEKIENETISAIRVELKSDAEEVKPVSIEEGIQKLAEKHVVQDADTDSSDEKASVKDEEVSENSEKIAAKDAPTSSTVAPKKAPVKRKTASKEDPKKS